MGVQAKIGVLTFHRCINYGSYWQARALVEGLRSLGHDAELLDHRNRRVDVAEWRCAMDPTLPRRTPRRLRSQYKAKARRFFDAFNRLPTSPSFPLNKPEMAPDYDMIVVGSDEVWNFRHPWYGGVPIFFGDGLKADRLVAYAASFGNHHASEGISPGWSSKLNNFAALSVRDSNSESLVGQGLGRKPELVLDPCLQFPPSSQTATPTEAGPYALVYGHGFPDWLARLMRGWSNARGVRLLSVGYANECADEQRIDVGPEEFARLMAGAGAVITNFFHGCVFALLGSKPFVAAASDYRSNKVRDLVAQLEMGKRLADSDITPDDFEALLAEPPDEQVQRRIAALREQSHAFLATAIS